MFSFRRQKVSIRIDESKIDAMVLQSSEYSTYWMRAYRLILAKWQQKKKLSGNMQSKISNFKFDMLWFVIFPHKLFRGFELFSSSSSSSFIPMFTVEIGFSQWIGLTFGCHSYWLAIIEIYSEIGNLMVIIRLMSGFYASKCIENQIT